VGLKIRGVVFYGFHPASHWQILDHNGLTATRDDFCGDIMLKLPHNIHQADPQHMISAELCLDCKYDSNTV
jgi:hypothetical protein